RARQAAADKGVIDNMHFVQCAAQDIAQHLESPVDLVLFHAVLGAAGLAVGLALQGSLSNLAAGVLLVMFRPFRAGEYVDLG
ncbi:mechanosensitive ion channel, partial [Klebsiella pneumoniae]